MLQNQHFKCQWQRLEQRWARVRNVLQDGLAVWNVKQSPIIPCQRWTHNCFDILPGLSFLVTDYFPSLPWFAPCRIVTTLHLLQRYNFVILFFFFIISRSLSFPEEDVNMLHTVIALGLTCFSFKCTVGPTLCVFIWEKIWLANNVRWECKK